MTALLARVPMDELRSVRLSYGAPVPRPGGMLFVGTWSCWVDMDFGISADPEDYVRLYRARALERHNELLAREMDRLAAESGLLDHLFGELSDSEIEEFQARNVSMARAETEIVRYLRHHPNTDAFDVALELRLDPAVVFQICERLLRQGRVEVAEDASGA